MLCVSLGQRFPCGRLQLTSRTRDPSRGRALGRRGEGQGGRRSSRRRHQGLGFGKYVRNLNKFSHSIDFCCVSLQGLKLRKSVRVGCPVNIKQRNTRRNQPVNCPMKNNAELFAKNVVEIPFSTTLKKDLFIIFI